MKKRSSRRSTDLGYEITINGQPFDEYIKQIPTERWEPFLDFLAELIVRDMRDHPELPGDSGPTN